MSKHTPEPWAIWNGGDGIIAAKEKSFKNGGIALTTSNSLVGGCEAKANARRIVACLNACAGLSTDELERFGLASAFGSEIVELKNQRDELLAALSSASDKMKAAHESMFEQCLSNPASNAWGKEINLSAINELQLAASRIDSAIAKAKGGEA